MRATANVYTREPGDMHNRQAIGMGGFIKSLMDYDLWPLYVVS